MQNASAATRTSGTTTDSRAVPYDHGQDPFFTDDTGKLKDSQHAILAGVVYTFAGKI